jgi:hypothetical protein
MTLAHKHFPYGTAAGFVFEDHGGCRLPGQVLE